MTDREILTKAEFVEYYRKRKGCFIQVWWHRPGQSNGWPQGWLARQIRAGEDPSETGGLELNEPQETSDE